MAKAHSHFGPWRLGWPFFGAELKRRREAAGLTQEELGEMVICSGGYIGQFEQAIRKPQLDHSQRIDKALQTDGFFERMWRELINRSPYANYFTDAAELEPVAENARAVFHAAQPLLPDEEVNERVAHRLARQRILKRAEGTTPPMYWAVLDEGVLRRPVGGAEAMCQQLEHIAAVVRERRGLVQVLPFAAGPHALMEGLVTLMSFADAPPVAYVESPHIGQLIDDPAITARMQMSYDLVRASALSHEESLSLIESVAEDYRK